MSFKCTDIELENAICRYVAGESMEVACYGVRGLSPVRLKIVLTERGIYRSKSERYGRASVSRSEFARIKRALPEAEICARYLSGESEKALANAYGIVRSTVRLCITNAGITPRNRSESMYLRMSQTSPEDRRALAASAHEAVRGRIRPVEELEKSAITRQDRKRHTSPQEFVLRDLLAKRGIETIHQQAIGPYNADLGAFPVAVEIFGGNWHASGTHKIRHPKRTRYLFDRGWNVIVVSITRNRIDLSESATDEVVAFIERSRSDPSFRRQYRVIRGDGKPSAEFGLDLDNIA